MNVKEVPAVAKSGTPTDRVAAAAGVTATVVDAASMSGLPTVNVWVPTVKSDTGLVKVCVPASAAVKV